MSAKVERRHREAAVASVVAVRAAKRVPPLHLMQEWISRETPMRDFLEEFFQPVTAVAQAIADAEQRGFSAGRLAERADVEAHLAALELREHERHQRQAEAAYYHARLSISCDEHVGAAERGKDGSDG
jgi:hypothetical protein